MKHLKGVTASFLVTDLLSWLNLEESSDSTLVLGTKQKITFEYKTN